MRQMFNPSVMLLNADIHGGTTGGGNLDHGELNTRTAFVTVDGVVLTVVYDPDDGLWYDDYGRSYTDSQVSPTP